ncbi:MULTISPECIES: peptidylprolyl isomerase [Brevundimonas]|uniref:peptidylprolyl isomerase n=1 Tax=Brevundimonas TaxID=41275 RepID=UPI0019063F53|nr:MULTISPECIES: peptidylprolyl isomerase [Brevundimonas]MDA0743462.1 peptidylprolyl isomerase [Pseudomonadota bacterium]MBK1968965.1 peptidylprolyl isomerase [Brevundimonas diminuta]MBK1975124.1 peptidylprolyl isomerase [Brevundimonas diminuta]MDA1321619.1 peptidylprolyl isomerase [Pseudomonadota bacterium]MDM8351554.1 peptidylprolyl isomerase [Brevundimonas diminuta]
MRLKRYSTGAALAALMVVAAMEPSWAQATSTPAPQQQGAQAQPAAGALNPAAEEAPQRATAAPQFRMADGIIATVNDRIITGFDLRQRMLVVMAMSQMQPTEENIAAIQQQALNDLIEQHLQAQEIAKFDQLKITDEEVDREIADMARQTGASPDAFVSFLQQGGIAIPAFREQIRTEVGWRDLVGGRFRDRARVSKSQVDQAMRQLTESATKPQYLVGEIYIEAARVGGMQEAVNGARQLVQQMIQGAPFMAVARQFSAAPSAARGGDAGWVVQGTVQPALQTVMDTLEVGQLSNPIPVDGGVYILYMRDKRSGASTSMVKMKQIMVEVPENADDAQVAAATQRLEALRGQLTCDNILERARSETGLLGADLGESDVDDLAPQFQQVARSAELGSISTPVRTPLGVHLLAVCDRRLGGPEAPSSQQVEARLQNQNYAMLGRRYLRDLREDALIEIKQ